EYEFDRSKGEMEEQERQTPEGAHAEGLHGADEPNAPQNVAERIKQVEQRAHEIVERRRAKQSKGVAALKGGAGKAAKKGAKKAAKKTAKKAAKKGTKKPSAGKGSKSGAGKKGASKKVAAKKSGAKRGASNRGGAR